MIKINRQKEEMNNLLDDDRKYKDVPGRDKHTRATPYKRDRKKVAYDEFTEVDDFSDISED
jgi:hypothetical protein